MAGTPERPGLAERFAFDEWRGRSTLEEELFVWTFAFLGEELPGWTLVELQQLPRAAGGPPVTRGLWGSTSRGRERVLEVQVTECESRLDAHTALLGALRQFQSPLVRRDDRVAVGDIAFGGPGRVPTMLLFARANLVYLVRNRARTVAAVADAAAGCDAAVTARPVQPAGPRVEARLARSAARVGERVGVTIDRALTPEPSVTLGRAFARGGTLSRADGELVFEPTEPGAGVVDIVVQRPSAPATERRLELEVT